MEARKANCPCTYGCRKAGHCDQCVSFHRARGEFPGCFFSESAEKTYDRSLDMLLKDRGRSGA